MGGVASRVESGEGLAQNSEGIMRGCSLKNTCVVNGGGGYVKLVQAGGKVVQVRGPVRAGDVMRSTQHYVTRSDVFRVFPPEAALLTPDTILMPGQKFYLVTSNMMMSLLRQEHLCKPANLVVEAPSGQSEKNQLACLPVLLHRQRNAKKSREDSHSSSFQSSRSFQDRSGSSRDGLSFQSGQRESFQSNQGNHLLIKSKSSCSSQAGGKNEVLQRSRLAPTYTQGFHSDQVDRSILSRSRSSQDNDRDLSSCQNNSCKSDSFLSVRGDVSSMRTNKAFGSKHPLLIRTGTYPGANQEDTQADRFQSSEDSSSSKNPQSSDKENFPNKSSKSTTPLKVRTPPNHKRKNSIGDKNTLKELFENVDRGRDKQDEEDASKKASSQSSHAYDQTASSIAGVLENDSRRAVPFRPQRVRYRTRRLQLPFKPKLSPLVEFSPEPTSPKSAMW